MLAKINFASPQKMKNYRHTSFKSKVRCSNFFGFYTGSNYVKRKNHDKFEYYTRKNCKK